MPGLMEFPVNPTATTPLSMGFLRITPSGSFPAMSYAIGRNGIIPLPEGAVQPVRSIVRATSVHLPTLASKWLLCFLLKQRRTEP